MKAQGIGKSQGIAEGIVTQEMGEEDDKREENGIESTGNG